MFSFLSDLLKVQYGPAIISSVIENCIVYPLDVFKILRQQRQITLREFIRSPLELKYRGFLYRLYGSVPIRVIFWTSQSAYAKSWEDISISRNFKQDNWCMAQKIGFVSALSGLNQTVVDSPFENLKIQQILYGRSFKPSFHIPTLYRGFSFHYLRNSIFILGVYGMNTLALHPDNTTHVSPFISGAIGGLCGCVFSQPFDYLKTLRQSNIPIQFKDILTSSLHRELCFTGVFPRVLAGTIGMSIGSFVYYYLNKFK